MSKRSLHGSTGYAPVVGADFPIRQSACPIVSATTKNCIAYQETAAAFHRDAEHYLAEGEILAATNAQRNAAEYYQAAWDRLARLIGVE